MKSSWQKKTFRVSSTIRPSPQPRLIGLPSSRPRLSCRGPIRQSGRRKGNCHRPTQISQSRARALAADAQVEQRRAQIEQAELNLGYTLIRSPVTGIVGKKTVEIGQNVSVGQELLTVVPLEDIWVTADFKETQLEHMRPGQPVEIKVDAYGRAWKGRVTNLGGGTGSVFSLLPPENATGNYVKVVQRVPVRIDFDHTDGQDFNAEGMLKPGLSVVPDVRVR